MPWPPFKRNVASTNILSNGPGYRQLLADRAFAVLRGADAELTALLGALGARVRACAPPDLALTEAEVLVLASPGCDAPAEAAWTDAARILVRKQFRNAESEWDVSLRFSRVFLLVLPLAHPGGGAGGMG